MTKVVIVGAGPAGLLAGHYLIRRPDYQVEIYEKRPDFCQNHNDDVDVSSGNNKSQERSFPMALQSRGLNAIRGIPGLEAALENLTPEEIGGEGKGVWTVGMSLHGKDNKERKITRPPALTVERSMIAATFLRELRRATPAENSSLTIHFDTAVDGIDVTKKTLTVTHSQHESTRDASAVSYNQLLVCDGARSKIRHLLSDQGLIQFEQVETTQKYKSFYILRESKDGKVRLDGDRLHGWMFGDGYQVISVPTRAQESSGVIIFPEGKDPFSDMKNSQAVLDYFQQVSPNSLAPLVTKAEAESLITRPVSSNIEVSCDRMTIGTDIVILGDACHAVSAAAGQGCNSSLQDVQVLMELLDHYDHDWARALPVFNETRLPEAHAVSEISNYNNPRTKLMRFEWIFRIMLTSLLPKWISDWLLRPMPMQLLGETDLPYTAVHQQCKWWTDRVKATAGQP